MNVLFLFHTYTFYPLERNTYQFDFKLHYQAYIIFMSFPLVYFFLFIFFLNSYCIPICFNFSSWAAICFNKLVKRKKKNNTRKFKKQPWMTDDLLKLVNRKNDLYRDWKFTSDNVEYERKKVNFKTYDRIVNRNIRDAKNLYYFNTFTERKNDMKQTWGIINETLNKGKQRNDFPSAFTLGSRTITDSREIANEFNTFFANVGAISSTNVDTHSDNNGHNDYLNSPTAHRFQFDLISECDIVAIINQMANKNSSGIDELSNKLLRSIKNEISKPLAIIINQSLQTGIFPDLLKISKIKPVYKKGNKCCFNNYRPIALLPTISKVFERVIHTQLYNYLNKYDLLAEQQYGFRSQHSTEFASVKLVDYIITEMDNKYVVKTPAAIYIDLSKAFDNLRYGILLDKLKYYGISGIPLELIKSYLTNRQQFVSYKDCESDLLEVKTGIPQGSILGPLFFSICINDIVNSTSKFNFLMYADDTTLYFNIEDFPLQSREADINNELKKVNTWLQLNKLSLNTDKSKFMLFHKKRTPPEINISINNSDIERVSQFTFLGIVLDETLSWKNHITMITNKLSRINGVLHRLKFIFPKNILLTIYKSLFMPHINYGSLVWGNNFEAISKLQERAIRTITHSHYIAHSEPLLKQLNLLKVKDMIDLKLLKFLHKLNASKLPQYFNSYKPYLEKNETKYNLRPNPLVMPAVNHVYAENLLIYRLVKLKNMFSLHYPLVDDKLNDGTHSLVGFGRYIAKVIIDEYSYQCSNNPCLPCGRL